MQGTLGKLMLSPSIVTQAPNACRWKRLQVNVGVMFVQNNDRSIKLFQFWWDGIVKEGQTTGERVDQVRPLSGS